MGEVVVSAKDVGADTERISTVYLKSLCLSLSWSTGQESREWIEAV